jgi:flagellar hook protein FlgE
MYAAISGLDANQTTLNAVANNLANVNTIGYKSSRVTFAESLNQLVHSAAGATPGNGGSNPEQIGLGVRVNSTDNEMTQGSFQTTNNPLDVAIEGEGFLRAGSGTPPAKAPFTSGLPTNVNYTRAGDLTTDPNGFLITQSGLYVVGREAVATVTEAGTTYAPGKAETYIVVPPGSANVAIGEDGSVSYTDENPASATYQKHVVAGYLTLAKFSNRAGLERVGGSLWAETANSGVPIVGIPSNEGFGPTVGGQLEMSNVDLASEMTSMVTAERGYQANARVITTADEMMSTVVNMLHG